MRYTDDDVTTNLSLQEKLKADFGISLPDVPEVDELSPGTYFAHVRKAIETQGDCATLGNLSSSW
jgi:hypothetical protein